MLSSSSSRPRFHVDIIANIASASSSGNQPPCRNLSEHAATSRPSRHMKKPVAQSAIHSGKPQP